MSTETAKITGVRREQVRSKGLDILDVEITYTRGRGDSRVEEVLRKGYPADTTAEEIKADLEKSLATRAAEREQAAAEQAGAEAQAEADATVAALEGLKVTQ